MHGVGGTLGAILTGVFATRAVQDLQRRRADRACSKAASCSTGQLVAAAITWVFAAVVTFVLLKVLDATMGLRVATQRRACKGSTSASTAKKGTFSFERFDAGR